MKSLIGQLTKLFLLTFIFISPMILIPRFNPARSAASNSTLISPLVFEPIPYQPVLPAKSKFAILIAKTPQPAVLGVQVEKEISAPAAENPNLNPSLGGSYTIALLGDSMVDVMQPDLPQLAKALKKYFPHAQFKLLNYGVGASNMEYGLTRLTQDYTYLGRNFPALLSQNPDIIVIESFAYNHWEGNQAGLDRQWLALASIIETIKKQSQAKIVLGAAIGPDENTLCDGIDGLNLPLDQKKEKAKTIRKYLQNIVNFANSQNYPLADAYHASIEASGNGKPVYINAGDHLHPSGPGGELFGQKIAEAIFINNLLQ